MNKNIKFEYECYLFSLCFLDIEDYIDLKVLSYEEFKEKFNDMQRLY